jgi:hypothetical protein
MFENTYVNEWDFLLGFLYIFIFYQIAKLYQSGRVLTQPHYRFFATGLLIKLIFSFFFCIVYVYYYNGGDSTAYQFSSLALKKLSFKKPAAYIRIMLNDRSLENYFQFDFKTGYPGYWYDSQSFSVVRFTSVFQYFSFESYIPATLVLSLVTYSGFWKLYLLFVNNYPYLYRHFAFSVLFIPSVCFWGGGIMKDSYTLCGALWLTYSAYSILIIRKSILFYSITAILAAMLIISIKPYIFVSLVIGLFLWISLKYISGFDNRTVKFILAPFILSIFIGIMSVVFIFTRSSLGQYSSLESILVKASVTQNDLKQEYYQGNSFDIGSFDPTIPGILSKFFPALTAGLFRPFIWEAKNFVMFISALENSVFILLLLYIIYTVGIVNFFRIILNEPILIFCTFYTILFSFFVGLSTANFGALVRYKIPCTLFYTSSLIIIWRIGTKMSRKAFRRVSNH